MNFDDVTHIAEEMKNAEKLTPEERQLLSTLNIELRRPPLPQHEVESRSGSRIPTHEEMERFKAITPLKKGYYNPTEDKIISDNWKAFCKQHNWNERKVQPFLNLRIDNKTHIRNKKQRKKFVQFLADGLDNRTLYSVYHRFRTLYEDHNHKRYSASEDSMILDHLEHNTHLDENRKYVDLAKVLNRSRASIWRRYKLLQKKRAKLENS